jgi:hypothetical protein
VVLPIEEFVKLKEGERWMVLLKVHTTKQFSNQPFFQKKKKDVAWGFVRDWTIHPIE